jgi:hypothetical protein
MIQTPINTKPVEFELLQVGGEPDHLCIGVFGGPGTGKTRLMATAPGLGVIPLQRKTRPTVEQVLRDLYPNRKVLWPKNPEEFYRYKNPMEMSLMDRDTSKKFHRALFDRIKQGCWSLLENKECRTIGIDSGYTLYQLCLAAHYGKSSQISDDKTAYGPPNTEFRELLISLQGKHVVFTTESKQAYKGKTPLDYNDPAGYKQIGYDTNVLVETTYEDKEFYLSVRMCQDRAVLQGEDGDRLLSGDMIEFKYLASQIRPDTNLEDWE